MVAREEIHLDADPEEWKALLERVERRVAELADPAPAASTSVPIAPLGGWGLDLEIADDLFFAMLTGDE